MDNVMVLRMRDCRGHKNGRPQGVAPRVEELEARRMLSGTLGYGFKFGVEKELGSGNAIATDAHGNTYVAGIFHGIVNVNPGRTKKSFLMSQNDSDDIFLAKYNPAGIVIWARRYGGTSNESVTDLKLGQHGEVYLSGTFEDTATFGLGKQQFQLTSNGKKDGFVTRIDGEGKVLWAGSIGGQFDDTIATLAVGDNGDVYISGSIRRTGDIDPSKAVKNVVTARGVDDTFIERLNGVDGTVRWTRIYGENNSSEAVNAMVVDPQGGLFVAGSFINTVQFDRSGSQFTLTSQGDNDIYLGHLTADGDWDRLRQIGGDNQDYVSGLVRNSVSGDLYLTGNFSKTVDFGPGPGATTLTAASNSDVYISRLRASGDFVWTRQFGGPDTSFIKARALAVDRAGNVYTTGDFVGPTDFPVAGQKPVALTVDKDGDAPLILNQPEAADAYITKLSPAGRLIYVRQIGGSAGSVLPYGISADNAGNAYITGAFTGIIDINPGPAVRHLHTHSEDNRETDVFVVQIKK